MTLSFTGSQLASTIEVLKEIANTLPQDSPEAVILLAATEIAARRALAVTQAQLEEIRA